MRMVMFDLETLNTEADSVVLTLGAVVFDPVKNEFYDELYLKFDVEQQMDKGRTTSDSTLEWWGKQAQEVQEAAFSETNRQSIEDCLQAFRQFVHKHKADRIWSQGSMDPLIMNHMYKQFGQPVPWSYWMERDSRTMFDFYEPNMDRSKHHDALEDAREQAKGVCTIVKKMGWKGQKF